MAKHLQTIPVFRLEHRKSNNDDDDCNKDYVLVMMILTIQKGIDNKCTIWEHANCCTFGRIRQAPMFGLVPHVHVKDDRAKA